MKKIIFILTMISLAGCNREVECTCVGSATIGGYTETHTEVFIVDSKKECKEITTDYGYGLKVTCSVTG